MPRSLCAMSYHIKSHFGLYAELGTLVRDIDTYVHIAQQIIFVSESTFVVQETPG